MAFRDSVLYLLLHIMPGGNSGQSGSLPKRFRARCWASSTRSFASQQSHRDLLAARCYNHHRQEKPTPEK